MNGAGKYALGQGLQAFGQQIGKQINAADRRRQSLEDIRLRYAMRQQERAEDREFQAQTRAEDREHRAGLLDERLSAQQSQLDQRLKAQEGMLDKRLNAQNRSSRSPLGRRNPEFYTPESRERFMQNYYETGREDDTLLEPAQRNRDDLQKEARDLAREELEDHPTVGKFIERNPDLAASYGVTPEDSKPEAMDKIASAYYQTWTQGQESQGLLDQQTYTPPTATGQAEPGGITEPGGLLEESVMDTWKRGEAAPVAGNGLLDPSDQGAEVDRVLAEAQQAIQAGAPREAVIARLREMGVPYQQILGAI